MESIQYPYLPEDCYFEYVKEDNRWILEAQKLLPLSGCCKQPVVCVIVKNGVIIGVGANGFSKGLKVNDFCKRIELGCKTGEGYEHCPQCVPKGHAEPMAISDALSKGYAIKNSEIYLYGHWWVCRDCWALLKSYGIFCVRILEDAHKRWG